MAVECGLGPREWLWHLGVSGAHACGSSRWVWLASHVCGGVSWMWFVTACVAVEVGCDWVPKCGHGNWM